MQGSKESMRKRRVVLQLIGLIVLVCVAIVSLRLEYDALRLEYDALLGTLEAPTPTNTPQPTATPVPGAPLLISPMPLVLVPTQANPQTCLATQTITNTANQVVGWAWQNPITQGGLHFLLNGKQVNSPPADQTPGIAPSGQDTLTVTSDCHPQSQSSAILVKDTLGTPYTFELTVQ